MIEIIVALIAGGFTFAGVIVSNASNYKKVVNDIKAEVCKNQAVIDYKIGELTREVREHNNFAKRMPVVENDIKNIKERMNEVHKND